MRNGTSRHRCRQGPRLLFRRGRCNISFNSAHQTKGRTCKYISYPTGDPRETFCQTMTADGAGEIQVYNAVFQNEL
ncbi:hypothetical protein FKM82_022205 [Ascaphus truei]